MGATTRRGGGANGDGGRRIARRRWIAVLGAIETSRAPIAPAETARVPRGARASAGARGDAAGGAGRARASDQDAHAIAHPRTRECWLVRVIIRVVMKTAPANWQFADGRRVY